MAVYRHYRCPDCRGTFRHFHHPNDAPPPDRCPLCDAWVSEAEPTFVPQAPLIKENVYAKSMDQTYRMMEESSIERAKEAADMLGVPEHEMSHLKITNLKDNVREGDISAVSTPTPVSQQIQQNSNQFGFQPLAGAIPNYQPNVGPSGTGHSTREQIVSQHPMRAAAMARAGQVGSYTPKG